MDASPLDTLDFCDKRVTVVGLGIEGADLVRYLCRHGARVTISDSKTWEQLASQLEQIGGLPVALSLGSDQTRDIADAEALFVSQGVPLELAGLQLARERGVPVYSMVNLFMEVCPGPVVGITGSSGKTTTTAMVSEMFEADERPVFVGGNIGVGLLDRLDFVRTYTWTVLELSHTQLQIGERSPHVAAILNITPNHLDRFGWDEYRRLKSNIIRYQTAADFAVLGYDDGECRALESEVKGRLLWFSLSETISGDGIYVRDGRAVLRRGGLNEALFELGDLRLRGEHNRANALAAAAIASACGVSQDAVVCAIGSFKGVPHRLEFIADVAGARYYNDSIATTPERTLAGIRSFEEPVVLLMGGRDKQLPLDELAGEVMKRCRAIVLFGESGGKLETALAALAGRGSPKLERAEGLAEAFEVARAAAQDGDVVLLSPACTSYDAYDNFEKRGEHFRALVQQIVKEAQPSLR